MNGMLSDLCLGFRIFRRNPGLALSAVFALAMGIGLTTTMFSIARGGTRSLPFDEPEELVVLTRTVPQGGYDLDPGMFDYVAWSRDLTSFDGLGAFETESLNVAGDGQRPERRPAALVTPGTFSILGASALHGRVLSENDASPGATPVVVLGHDLWRDRFGSAPDILGRAVRIGGEARTVVGVMPPGFGFPVRASMWLPLVVEVEPIPSVSGSGLRVFGRLADDVSLDEAAAELAVLAAGLAREHAATHGNLSARVMPFAEVEMAKNTPAILYLMLGCVSFILIIASANVANVLLARAATRSRELAMRTALGASRRRIVALHLSESLALASVGGVLGVAIAHVAVRLFAASTSHIIEAFWIDFRVDWAALLFATAMVAVAGFAAGIVPGLRASRAGNLVETLKDSGGGTTGIRLGRLARGLVFAEVALATGLLIMTMTFTKTAVALRSIELPFDADSILVAQLGLTRDALDDDAIRERVARELPARLGSDPRVKASALVSVVPGRGAGNWSFALDTRPAPGERPRQTTGVAIVDPGFFDLVGAGARRGRLLDWSDRSGAPVVAVVNESWVRRFSADREPLGRQLWLGETMLEVVGVVPDLQMQDPEDRAGDGLYASILQVRPYAVRVIARTAGDPLAVAPLLRDAAESIDRDLPVFEVSTLHDAIYADKKVLDAFGAIFFVAGLGAVFLTIVGVYGVVSFAFASRTRELGVRLALGASRAQIARLVVGQGARLIASGTIAGLAIAFGISHALAAATEFLEPASPLTFVAIAVILFTAAAAGLARPLHRALTLAPMVALRRD